MAITHFDAFQQSLPALAGTAAMSGQELPEDARTPGPEQLLNLPGGVFPALLGANVLVGDVDDQSQTPNVQQYLSAHANAGGATVLCMHPPNFFSGTQRLWGAGTSTDRGAWVSNTAAAKPNLLSLLSGTSLARLRYLHAIQRVIAYIRALPADSPVIFRPWHEATGSWFWWGLDQTNPSRSEAGVKALWADTIAQVKTACPNVIAGFSAGMSYYADELYGYPGVGVDVVGTSLYSDTATFAHPGDYQKLVSTGKPVFLFEVGNASGSSGWDLTILRNALAQWYPQVVGWVAWQDGYALINCKNAAALLNDSRTVNLGAQPQPPQPKFEVYADHPLGTVYASPTGTATVATPVY